MITDSESENIQNLLNDIAEAVKLREGPRGIEIVLRTVYLNGPIGIKALARRVRMPVPVIAAIRGEMEKLGYFERQRDGIALTVLGVRNIEAGLGLKTSEHFTCNACNGKTIQIPSRFDNIIQKIDAYTKTSPSVDTTLDQALSTSESALKRVLFMYEQGAIEGKRVLILGDDDRISLTIAMLGRTISPSSGFTKRLTVLEYDQRWVDYLRAVAYNESLDIEIIQADLREPLPEYLVEGFDTFETDPPYTLEGIRLFVSRGIEALENGQGFQGFLSVGAKPPDEEIIYQRELNSLGLMIAQVIPNFNVYQGASILGGTSHLYHLITTNATAHQNVSFSGEIYTGNQNLTVRVFQCMNCGKNFDVGKEFDNNTIEILKSRGCDDCGQTNFQLISRRGK
jgi:predicted methyltransferase